jgi:1-acyl-sn-glycerol-3-phosphate acyltransferase
VEPVYSSVITVGRAMFAAQGLRFTLTGTDHIPRIGGALLVMNHVGFFDFTYAGLAARPAKRYVRFMGKAEVFAHPVAGALMRGMHHIPVDRMAGTGSFVTAVQALCAGELVGVFPEATISSSFELKAFKSGAARMALEAGVPLLPTIIWGSQRVWTKRQPTHLGRTRTPITVDVGAPVAPIGSALELTKTMHAQMMDQLTRVQRGYADGNPAGAFWVPARLGGGAPTPAQANEQDRADTRGKVAKRREKVRRRAC